MPNNRVESELDTFFCELKNLPKQISSVTSSAFTQYRGKLGFSAFTTVLEALVQHFYRHYSYTKYHGLRLVAIDGTVLTLPKNKATIKEFGDNVLSKNGKWIKAQVSFAADVLNNICLDAVIGAYKVAETSQALAHLQKLGSNNLYLFDRGYFGKRFLEKVYATGSQFCFRVQSNACKEIKGFIAGGLVDTIIKLSVENQHYIKIRLTRIILDNGEEEYLVSSLFDQNKFTISQLKELYHKRWGVEEQYKDIKHAIAIENFIGKKPNSIKQEFYASILTYNVSMMILKRQVDKKANKTKKKHIYKANKRAILAKFKQCFVKLFFTKGQLHKIIQSIIKYVTKESVPIRKNRKYERNPTFKAKKKFHRAYIPVT